MRNILELICYDGLMTRPFLMAWVLTVGAELYILWRLLS